MTTVPKFFLMSGVMSLLGATLGGIAVREYYESRYLSLGDVRIAKIEQGGYQQIQRCVAGDASDVLHLADNDARYNDCVKGWVAATERLR